MRIKPDMAVSKVNTRLDDWMTSYIIMGLTPSPNSDRASL